MPNTRACRTWISHATAVTVGALAATTTLAAPAQADPATDPFLNALSSAGVNYGDPAMATSLGQSICPMLSQPGGSFAKTASQITGNGGLSPDMAGLFTSIAISMYCPSMMTSLGNGDLSSLSQIPGIGSFLSIPGF